MDNESSHIYVVKIYFKIVYLRLLYLFLLYGIGLRSNEIVSFKLSALRDVFA